MQELLVITSPHVVPTGKRTPWPSEGRGGSLGPPRAY